MTVGQRYRLINVYEYEREINMLSYAEIDEKIQVGYAKIYEENDLVGGCDVWLEAWEGIKLSMNAEGLATIDEVENLYDWQQFIFNFVQDLATELWNASIDDKTYSQKHIDYCEELIARCGDEKLMLENTRRDMAASHFKLGNQEKGDQLFSEWLQTDPDWGWGYIGWADCYAWKQKGARYDRADEILALGLSRHSLRDRKDVLERAIQYGEDSGDTDKVRYYRQELRKLASVHVKKVGRNEPCPCGSGKKYKKCCGA